MVSKAPHSDLFLNPIQSGSKFKIDGSNLSVRQLVDVSRSSTQFELDQERLKIVDESKEVLKEAIKVGKTVYGVTTFFGGSANQTVKDVGSVQKALLGLLAGVLPSTIVKTISDPRAESEEIILPIGTPLSHSMPISWVRGAILLRINNFLRGHSSVRWKVIEMLHLLLEKDLIPLIPIQGSISASGDLSPLSYIAFTLTGNPSVYVSVGKNNPKIMSAREALSSLSIEPIIYSPKEVLGLVNGTSISCSVAALALSKTNELTHFSQIITSLNLQGLLGCKDEFDEFIHDVRPHPGQIEVAQNMRSFIEGSCLVRNDGDELSVVDLLVKISLNDDDDDGHDDDRDEGNFKYGEKVLEIDDDGFFLKQDRYALRTSPQWLGPALEDLTTATKTLEIELNSTTDNPLTDSSRKITLHGGNFQATSVTNLTEKNRDVCSIIGKLLFSQSSELCNDKLSNGLNSNLSPGEPGSDGGFKGLEIGLASFTSELGFLANRCNHFVQSAENHNQSLNSLALISARYTIMAVETLAKLVASSLILSLQALDLRSLFISNLKELSNTFKPLFSSKDSLKKKDSEFRNGFLKVIAFGLLRFQMLDSEKKFHLVAQSTVRFLLRFPEKIETLKSISVDNDATVGGVNDIQGYNIGMGAGIGMEIDFLEKKLRTLLSKSNEISKERFFKNSIQKPNIESFITHKYISKNSSKIYNFVRKELGIPFYRGVFDLPGSEIGIPNENESEFLGEIGKGGEGFEKRNLGENVSKVYDSLMDGRILKILEDSL